MISFTKIETIIAVLTFIILAATAGQPTQEIADLKQSLLLFDKDGDGCLNLSEFKEMMSSTGGILSPDNVKELFNDADTNHSGKVNIDEFITMMANHYDNILKEDFEEYDKDKNGYISEAELSELLRDHKKILTEEEVYEKIRSFDADGDGKISFEEYKNLMESL